MLSFILVILVANILYGIGSADQNEETLNFDAMTLKDTVTLQDPGIMPSYYISDSDHKGDVIMYTRGADSIIRLKQRTHQVKRRTSPTNINYLVTTDDKEYIVAVENPYMHNILQLLNKDMDVVDEYRPGSEEEWKAWQYLAYVSPHRFMVLEESDTYYQGQSTTSKANIKTISVVNQSLIVESDVEIDFVEGWKIGDEIRSLGDRIFGRDKEPKIHCGLVYPNPLIIPRGHTKLYFYSFNFVWIERGHLEAYSAPYDFMHDPKYHIVRYYAYNDGHVRWCDLHFVVHLVTCPNPSNPQNGVRSCTRSYGSQIIWGDTCRTTCNPGYKVTLTSSSTNTCGGNGQFSPAFGKCEKKLCSPPIIGEHMTVECRSGHYFGSSCTYLCHHGFGFKNGTIYATQCLADQTWSDAPPECIDIEPPVIESCPLTMFLVPDRLSENVNATWDIPTATDAHDGPVPVDQVEGPPPGSPISGNSITTITYRANDTQGNQAIPCTFRIIVQGRTCPPYPPSLYLNSTCYDNLLWGSRCELNCLRGYNLVGNSTVFCEEDQNRKLFWDWGDQLPFCQVMPCHKLPPPLNGALSYDTWLHGIKCQMMCNAAFDIPRTVHTTGVWVCDDTVGVWDPPTTPPGCTEVRRPGDMNLPSDLFYFSGDCTSQETQDQIRDNFIRHLNQSQYKALCTLYPECSVDNVDVVCGPTGYKKKSGFEFSLHISFDFIIKLVYPVNFTSEDYTPYLSSVDTQFYAMADQFQTDVSNGILDLDVHGLDTYVDPDTFYYGRSDMKCGVGMVPRFPTFSCASCPTGTKFNRDINDCEPCPVGQYQDEDGQLTCKLCPDITSTLDTGSTNVTHCIELCDYGYFSDTGMLQCAPCPVGTYQDNVGSKDCIVCPDNKTTVSTGSNGVELCMDEGDIGGIEACNTTICNGGYCVTNGTKITCLCNDGYIGEFCEIPDLCRYHDCQNGATCEADGSDGYTCFCAAGFDGLQCEDQIINGGRNPWSQWSECSVSCGHGERTRNRTCDNPPPGFGGAPCYNDGRQTESCDMGECPECPRLEFPARYIYNCTQTGDEINCDVTCEDGYVFNGGVVPSVSCGALTNYEWSYGTVDPDAKLPDCTESSIPENIETAISLQYPEVPCHDADEAIIEQVETIVDDSSNCKQLKHCEVEVTSTCLKGRTFAEDQLSKKRTTDTLSVVIGLSGHVYNTEYFNGGQYDNVSAVAAAYEYATLLTEFDAILVAINNATESGDLNVTMDGQVYAPLSAMESHMYCPSGKVDTSGFCANCPQGSKQHGSNCTLCSVGHYQEYEGQTYCDKCKDGYTTQHIGARSAVECVLKQTEEDVLTPGNGSYMLVIILSVCGALLCVVAVAGVLVAWNKWHTKNRIAPE